uniref:Response regulator transcription factor n=1 Tax=Roseihalotalea indica TaxID=2867963 RepID=A0AA49JER5_9BACT|nr:response regulator transcription factor [Tunicatimonas sp. TK19036]
MHVIDILVVDDHQMIREGIKASLQDIPDIQVVAEAANNKDALQKLRECPEVSVVVMDISLGEGEKEDGTETTRAIVQQFPHVQVLALSMHDEEAHITSMLQAGAIGYLLKDTDMDELVAAIRAVGNGESYFCRRVSNTMMNRFMQGKKKAVQGNHACPEQLTKREREILKLIAEENTNPEIAEKLFISTRTVDTHRRNLILKLNVKNTAGLVRYAIKHELVHL